jgi:hypothetical protein
MTGYRIISPTGYVYNYGSWTTREARGQVFASCTAATCTMIARSMLDCCVEQTTLEPDDECPPTERNT